MYKCYILGLLILVTTQLLSIDQDMFMKPIPEAYWSQAIKDILNQPHEIPHLSNLNSIQESPPADQFNNEKSLKSILPLLETQQQNKKVLKHNDVKTTSKNTCSICTKSFRSPKYLNEHKREVHEKRFTCSICKKKFGKKSNYTRHTNAQH